MGIYRYNSGSIIDRVTFVKTDAGGSRAYLHACKDTDLEQIALIKQGLSLQSWQYVPCTDDKGEPVLEIRGYKDEAQMLQHLRKNSLISGVAQHTESPKSKTSFKDWVKKSTLGLSGMAYFAGDVGYTKYGYAGGQPLDMAAGLAYFGGSATLFAFGKGDKSHYQIKDLSRKLVAKLDEDGVIIPSESVLHQAAEGSKKGFVNSVRNIFDKYPAEVMNGFFAIAGALILGSAVKRLITSKGNPIDGLGLDAKLVSDYGKFKNVGKYLDIGLGSMTITSGLVSMFMKEKAPDPDAPEPTTVWGKLMAWIREKPLRVAGYGYMVSTMMHAGSTYLEHKYATQINSGLHATRAPGAGPGTNGKTLIENFKEEKEESTRMLKSIPWRALFVGMNLIAEFLMAISSKGHGEGVKADDSIEKSAYNIATDLIARQPAHRRESMIEYMAGYLAVPEVLGGKQEEIADKLRNQLGAMLNNPWAQDVHIAQALGTKHEQSPGKSHVADTGAAPRESQSWVNRTATMPALQPQLSV